MEAINTQKYKYVLKLPNFVATDWDDYMEDQKYEYEDDKYNDLDSYFHVMKDTNPIYMELESFMEDMMKIRFKISREECAIYFQRKLKHKEIGLINGFLCGYGRMQNQLRCQ